MNRERPKRYFASSRGDDLRQPNAKNVEGCTRQEKEIFIVSRTVAVPVNVKESARSEPVTKIRIATVSAENFRILIEPPTATLGVACSLIRAREL